MLADMPVASTLLGVDVSRKSNQTALTKAVLVALLFSQATCAETAAVLRQTAYQLQACPDGALVRVTPFHVLIQPTRPNGHLWDDVSGAVTQTCGFVTDPGKIVRSTLDVDAGAVGNQALDLAMGKAVSSFGGEVTKSCEAAGIVIDVLNLIKGPSAPDVYLTYGVVGAQQLSSRVIEDATPQDLQNLQRELAPIAVRCEDRDQLITVTATDRDSSVSTLTLGLADPSDQEIGSVTTSLRNIGDEQIRRGFAYVPASQPNGLVAVGLLFAVDKSQPSASATPAEPQSTSTAAVLPPTTSVQWGKQAEQVVRNAFDGESGSNIATSIQRIAHPTGENPSLASVDVTGGADNVVVQIRVNWKGGLLGTEYSTVVKWEIRDTGHVQAVVVEDSAPIGIADSNAKELDDYFRTTVYPVLHF